MPAVARKPVIIWFRNDLRIADNPALALAAETGAPALCVYVEAPEAAAGRPLGGAAKWWLAGSLRELERRLAEIGGRLDVVRGDPAILIPEIARASGASLVVWNRRYSSAEQKLDAGVKASLAQAGVEARSSSGHLLHEPWTIATKAGGPVKVFSAFWRAAQAIGGPARANAAPTRLESAPFPALAGVEPVAVDALGLEPADPDWAGGMRAEWTRGETGAIARLHRFLDGGVAGYAAARDRPALPGTSRLSPHLRFGEISIRQCWITTEQARERGVPGASEADFEVFLKELGWREFSYHLLHHNPELATVNYTSRFDGFPWREDAAELHAWRKGRTGYPIVDAGMRQLWETGWMHNRVRMIVASFLVKHLVIDWRRGEEWFWDTLVDADPANNAASWQWVAGTGADAAPYFRIFNPMLQGEKFDPDGAYVRTWLPELARLPARYVHQPWTAPAGVLAASGVALGRNYPYPLVKHEAARARALAALRSIRADAPGPDEESVEA
jgi:deoxyribodipyrimidine photo-lyase